MVTSSLGVMPNFSWEKSYQHKRIKSNSPKHWRFSLYSSSVHYHTELFNQFVCILKIIVVVICDKMHNYVIVIHPSA